MLKHGDDSPCRDFFIDWNAFWRGTGEMTARGYIQPAPEYLRGMNMRKPSLPLLMVPMPDGRDVPFWNTFYQEVVYPRLTPEALLDIAPVQYAQAARLCRQVNAALDGGLDPDGVEDPLDGYRDAVVRWLKSRRVCRRQMDLYIQSPAVWNYYGGVMDTLRDWGTNLIRLDALTRLHKQPGRANFMNEPETWDILARLKGMAEERGMRVLPEMHVTYQSGVSEKLERLGCPCYDYYLPGLILDAVETRDPKYLIRWLSECAASGLRRVSMLGCHDGIPIRDLKGLLPQERIDGLCAALTARGGVPKMIHGERPEVYQMACAYYSALDADDDKMALARAIQVFAPGICQVWYMDLLCRENDLAALKGGADPREINRSVLSEEDVRAAAQKPGFVRQMELLRLRKAHPAFAEGASCAVESEGERGLVIRRAGKRGALSLRVDFGEMKYAVTEG